MLLSEELDVFIRRIEPTNHLILFYDTAESKHRILFNFLADGLEKGKGAVYICSEERPEQIRSGMESFGIDVDKDERAGNLIIRNYDEWYIEKGRAESLKIIARWNKIHEHFKNKGLGMRAAGELSCFFKHNMVRELLRYEYALHRILFIPMEAICAYNIQTIVNTGYTEMIMPLVRAHGRAIFTANGGSMILEPENVEDSDIERLLEIRI